MKRKKTPQKVTARAAAQVTPELKWTRLAALALGLFGLTPLLDWGSYWWGVASQVSCFLVLGVEISFLDPWFSSRRLVKCLIPACLILVIALLLISIFRPAPLSVDAHIANKSPYPPGTFMGKIRFESGFTDTRVDIKNESKTVYTKVDLLLDLKDSVVGYDQLQKGLPACVITPNNPPTDIHAEFAGKLNYTIQFTSDLSVDSIYRLRCDKLMPNDAVNIVFATANLGIPGTLTIPLGGPFGPMRSPEVLDLKGTYFAAHRERQIAITLPLRKY